MSENELLTNALKYASEYGWAVFPVSASTKKPLTPHGCKDAKKDPGAIRAWWKRYPDASIGVATGSMSNLIVIDEDIDEDKSLDGYQEVCQWEKDNGDLPETVRAITGRGGAHLYYKYTGKDITNRAGILDGVDVRGEGGYVIAPPSYHPNGTQYQWEEDPEDIPIAEVDETIKKFLEIGHSSSITAFKLPQVIPSGQRNATLYKLACSLQARGFEDSTILEAVMKENQQKCDVPLSEDEVNTLVQSALTYKKGEMKVIEASGLTYREPQFTYMLDKDGNPTNKIAQTILNAEEAIAYDTELFGKIAFNELSYSPCVYGNLPWQDGKGWREWTNADDSNLRSYIESKYGLKNKDKIIDALNNVIHRHKINPVKDMLEYAHTIWDGNKHVENLLTRFVGAEKTPYNMAVMRLYMLGAVSRIYKPGCKFDYMLILVGKQGAYKSSFLRFLAGSDTWFADNFNTLDGDKAFEKLRGMWIVEMSELQATKRAKDVESIKAFITSTIDIYRTPYERRTEQRPRQCVLAGTSNPVDFLTDKTGNRRFLPVTCSIEPVINPFDDLEATHYEFIQAWGEIMDEYKQKGGKISLVLPKDFEDAALASQLDYLEDDPKIGMIQEWLDNTDNSRVCAMMIWKEALGNMYVEPRPQDINAIHEIMKNNITGWKSCKGKVRCGKYGVQRSYDKKGGNK